MKEQSLECVYFRGHLLIETAQFRVIDGLQADLQFVLVVHRSELQVTLDLLPHGLEAIDHRQALYRVDPVQRFQADVGEFMFARDLSKVNYRLRKQKAKR